MKSYVKTNSHENKAIYLRYFSVPNFIKIHSVVLEMIRSDGQYDLSL
jgi:hypothetical protein